MSAPAITVDGTAAMLAERFAAPLGLATCRLALYEYGRECATTVFQLPLPDAGTVADKAAIVEEFSADGADAVAAHYGTGAMVVPVDERMAGVIIAPGGIPASGAAVTEPAAVDALCQMAVRMAAEAYRLRRLRNEYEQIILSVGEGILAVDHERRVVFMNPVAVELFGLGEVRPAGQLLAELVPGLPLDRFWKALADGEHTVYEELTLEGDVRRELGVSLLKVADPAGRPAGVIMSLRDLQAEKDVERMREEFITTVSHEFRTPLTSIKSFSEMLLTYDDEDQETRKEFLGIINKESDTLHRLVEDALTISRLEGDSVEWRPAPMELKELVEERVAEMQPGFGERNLAVELRWNAGDVTLVADRLELGRALDKLLDNCRKFADEGTTVYVDAGCTGEACELRFTDTGETVPAENGELIFQKFKQGDDFMHNKADGTGLGLPICRRVVEYHGGTVKLERSGGGETVFAVSLPLPDRTT